MDKFNEIWYELGIPFSDPEGGYFVLVNMNKVKLPDGYSFPPQIANRPRDFKYELHFRHYLEWMGIGVTNHLRPPPV